MSDSTKINALLKLNTFYVKVGYPDKLPQRRVLFKMINRNFRWNRWFRFGEKERFSRAEPAVTRGA